MEYQNFFVYFRCFVVRWRCCGCLRTRSRRGGDEMRFGCLLMRCTAREACVFDTFIANDISFWQCEKSTKTWVPQPPIAIVTANETEIYLCAENIQHSKRQIIILRHFSIIQVHNVSFASLNTHTHTNQSYRKWHTGKFAGRTRAKLNKFRVRRDALALTPKTVTSANLPKNMTSVYFSSLRIEEWSKWYRMWCIILLIIQFILPWS